MQTLTISVISVLMTAFDATPTTTAFNVTLPFGLLTQVIDVNATREPTNRKSNAFYVTQIVRNVKVALRNAQVVSKPVSYQSRLVPVQQRNIRLLRIKWVHSELHGMLRSLLELHRREFLHILR